MNLRSPVSEFLMCRNAGMPGNIHSCKCSEVAKRVLLVSVGFKHTGILTSGQ